MPYQVLVKTYGRWAAPWSFDTWNEAKQRAADVRHSAIYNAVKIRKVMASGDEVAIMANDWRQHPAGCPCDACLSQYAAYIASDPDLDE